MFNRLYAVVLGRKFGVEKVNRHDAPVYADARVMLPNLLREAPVARAPVRRQDDHATFVFRDPVRRRRETTRQCGLADVQMAVPGVIAQKNMMRVSKVRCRDTLEILATCRVRHASCKSWRLVFR